MESLRNQEPHPPASRGKKIAYGAAVGAFVLLLVLLAAFVGKPLISNLSDPAAFRDWAEARGAWGKILFVGMCLLQVVVAFIPAEPLEIAAGYAFGAVYGALLVWVGLVLGSAIVFFLVRRFGVRVVEVFFSREQIDSYRFLRDEKRLGVLFFFLYLIPGTPKDFLAYCAGLTKIRFLPWLIVTSLARIPSIVTSTVGGNALGTKNYGFAIGVFGITAVLCFAGMLLYARLEKRRAQREALKRLAELPLNEATPPENDTRV